MNNYNSENTNNSYKQFHRSESVPNNTKRLIEMLDRIEERVELLREHAVAIETERSALLQMLSTIKSNKDFEQITEVMKGLFFGFRNAFRCDKDFWCLHIISLTNSSNEKMFPNAALCSQQLKIRY
ncbi:UNVERIFIED_CONTAM: BAG family molecular chaperone regulator 2 [Trichonephila clavipes]